MVTFYDMSREDLIKVYEDGNLTKKDNYKACLYWILKDSSASSLINDIIESHIHERPVSCLDVDDQICHFNDGTVSFMYQ